MPKRNRPDDYDLDKIKNLNAQKRLLRIPNERKKLAGKIFAWKRKVLEKEKGGASIVPFRPGLHFDGKETSPGTTLRPYMKVGLKKLGRHIAGTPIYICELAEDANKSPDPDYVHYIVDKNTGRPEIAVGRIQGKHPGRKKGTLPQYLGGVTSKKQGDHKGHGIPEGGVDDPSLVNHLANFVPQDGTTNVSHKKIFENKVIEYAEMNKSKRVFTLHERFYEKDALRPLSECHYMVVDGFVTLAVTIDNP